MAAAVVVMVAVAVADPAADVAAAVFKTPTAT
jgi:hypothetical protein